MVEAHGSFAHHHCIQCKSEYPEHKMMQAIGERSVPHCETTECNGLVKPDIVFFGEALPASFHQNRSLPADADLCIVMGTSLSVQPFASLPNLCPDDVPRLLINLEQAGGLGSRLDDVLLLEDCDTGIRKLAAALDWQGELESVWRVANPDTKHGFQIEEDETDTHEENVDQKVAKLTEDINHSLQISNLHADTLREQLVRESQDVRPCKAPTVARYTTNAVESTASLAYNMNIKEDSAILPAAPMEGSPESRHADLLDG